MFGHFSTLREISELSKPGAKKSAEYKYETHLHTSETSVCGATPGADHVARFKKLGYAGIFVTERSSSRARPGCLTNIFRDGNKVVGRAGFEPATSTV